MEEQQTRQLSWPILGVGILMLLASLGCALATPAPDRGPDLAGGDLATSVAAQGTTLAQLATRVTALEQEHDQLRPTVRPTEAPSYIVEGSVEFEGGRCCAGGTAGETIQVSVDFAASSSAGEVTEIRVATGSIRFDEAALADLPWEPIVPQRSYPVKVAINWVGFWISAQYRDEAGNVSPVVYDDISIEGAPAEPEP